MVAKVGYMTSSGINSNNLSNYMIRVILESPYAGDIERNVKYARMAVRDSLSRGEAPIASHLLYTQEGILKDEIPEERQWGIDAGLAWKEVAVKHVFYVDYGYSRGMEYAKQYATKTHIPIEERRLF
jgi:hypothetical protein